MSIGVLAEAANGTLRKGLAVHVAEELPSDVGLSHLYHALHGMAIVPQPHCAVVVGIVFVVIVPVFVLGVEVIVELAQ